MLRVDRVGGGSKCEMTHGGCQANQAAGHMIHVNRAVCIGTSVLPMVPCSSANWSTGVSAALNS